MKILGLKNWSWIFFEDEDEKYLEVVCGTVGLYTVIIKLNETEIEQYFSKGILFIEGLTKSIQSKPDSFKDRFLKFENENNLRITVEEYRRITPSSRRD
jgi:hypothetical protein